MSLAIYVCLSGIWLGGLFYLSFLSYFFKLVCYAHVFPCIYMHTHMHIEAYTVHVHTRTPGSHMHMHTSVFLSGISDGGETKVKEYM